MWDLILSVPDHCLSFYFSEYFPQRPCDERGCSQQTPECNWSPRWSPNHGKEKEIQMRWYSHISRSSDIAKTILQGTVKGARRRWRQKKRWEENIKEWTGNGVWRFPEGSKRQGRMERYCYNVMCGAMTTSEGLRWDDDDDMMLY